MKKDKDNLGGDERPQRSREPAPVVAGAASHAEILDRLAADGGFSIGATRVFFSVHQIAALRAGAEALQVGLSAMRSFVDSVAERSDAFNDKILVVPRDAYLDAVRVLDEAIDTNGNTLRHESRIY